MATVWPVDTCMLSSNRHRRVTLQAASAAGQEAEARRLAELQLLMMDEGQLRRPAGAATGAGQGISGGAPPYTAVVSPHIGGMMQL